jgi:hypothetical protein
MRDEMSGAGGTTKHAKAKESARGKEGLVAPFLRAWKGAMGDWSSGNREALREPWRR